MRIFANQKIKALFYKILICMLALTLLSVVFLVLKPENAALYILLSSLGMGIIILAVCYGYFKKQNEIMENAVEQITDYITGSREIRIACDEEGELYRLFHEVNSLAAILNASA